MYILLIFERHFERKIERNRTGEVSAKVSYFCSQLKRRLNNPKDEKSKKRFLILVVVTFLVTGEAARGAWVEPATA
jgi:hypothetical protein